MTRLPQPLAAAVVALLVQFPLIADAGRHLDAAGRHACTSFQQMMFEARNGLLAESEVRPRLRAVHEQAARSATPGLADEATALLAEILTGTHETFMTVAQRFDEACKGPRSRNGAWYHEPVDFQC